jgi:glycerophosphoryl diester phosphodiesterase
MAVFLCLPDISRRIRFCRDLSSSLPQATVLMDNFRLRLQDISMRRLSALLTIVLVLTACAQIAPGLTQRPLAIDNKPLVIAHRAGAADYPENTLLAITQAVRNHADMVWLTVQLSRDGVPVLYRPEDLATNTNGSGTVASKDFAELQRLNAGWQFAVKGADGSKTYPYRTQPLPVPSLDEALRAVPPAVQVILDMKALPAGPQAQAVARVLDARNAWNRVLLYSTDASYTPAFEPYPQARLFETRDATRSRLARVALADECAAAPEPGAWVAFEYRRNMDLEETFTLGAARSAVSAKLWTPASIRCFRSKGKVNIVAIGINNADDYRAAACLSIDAVLADSPRTMSVIKSEIVTPVQCR